MGPSRSPISTTRLSEVPGLRSNLLAVWRCLRKSNYTGFGYLRFHHTNCGQSIIVCSSGKLNSVLVGYRDFGDGSVNIRYDAPRRTTLTANVIESFKDDGAKW